MMLGVAEVNGGTQAKVVMGWKATAASDAQTVVNAKSLNFVNGRDGSWVVVGERNNTTGVYVGPGRRGVSMEDWTGLEKRVSCSGMRGVCTTRRVAADAPCAG